MEGQPLSLENYGNCLFCKRPPPAPPNPLERRPLRTFFQYLQMKKVEVGVAASVGSVDLDAEVVGSLCKGCGSHLETFLKLKEGMETTMETCLGTILEDMKVGSEKNEEGSEYPIREGIIMMKALERLRMTKPFLDSQNVGQSLETSDVQMITESSGQQAKEDARAAEIADLQAKLKSLEERMDQVLRGVVQNGVNPAPVVPGLIGDTTGRPDDSSDSNGRETGKPGGPQVENGTEEEVAGMQMDVEDASASHSVTLKRSHEESPSGAEDVDQSLPQTPSTSKKRKLTEPSRNSDVRQLRSRVKREIDLEWEVKPSCSGPELVALANHAYFLKNVPQEEEKNLIDTEQLLLEKLASCVAAHLPGLKSTHLFQNTVETFECWRRIQAVFEAEVVHSELNKMGAGGIDNFTVFVKEQNCLVNMKMLPGQKNVRVMTWRGSLPNEMVMKGPIKATYPERLDVVPVSELLMSKCFANQLTNLHLRGVDKAMPASHKDETGRIVKGVIEAARPVMVSEFLVALLCPNCDDSKPWSWLKIEKKVRDSVNWKSSNARGPWRRSGIWMAAKALLSLSIFEEVGNGNEEEARIIYKTTLLLFLFKICKEMSQVEIKNWDILKQMMVKLARRTRKLQDLIPSSTNVELVEAVKEHLSIVFTLVEGIHTRVTCEWQKLSDSLDIRNGIKKVSTTEKVLQTDRHHFMQELNKYLKSNRQPSLQTQVCTGLGSVPEVNQETELPQLISRGTQLSTDDQDVHLNTRSIWLFQVEMFCRTLPEGLPYSSNDVHTLFMRYAEIAIQLFRENPVAVSRAVVTLFILLRYLDRVAIEKHPLLQKYKTSVNPSLLEKLLIPEKEEMIRITSIQNYFTNRNKSASYPSWVESSSLSSASFAVQYARQNAEMQALKKAILKEDEARHIKKRQELDKARENYTRVQSQLSKLNCQYTVNSHGRKEHVHPCQKCLLTNKVTSIIHSVIEIQKTLPECEVARDGIVFELKVPLEIAQLRDATSILIGEVLAQSHSMFSPEQKDSRKYWFNFVKSQQNCHSLQEITQVVRLGSTVKNALALKYPSGRRKQKYRPHVMDSYETYYLGNGLNCAYFRTNKLGLGSPPQDLLTMKLSTTSALSSAPYENLQWALDEKRVTENEVIARQYSCHQKLSLKEFVAFGSLRSGEKIQLRNLYIAMATRTLSLENEAVLALIMQTLWELGGLDKDGRREIHVDLEDKEFSLQFLGLLEKLVKENESCWGSPLTMISVVLVAIRTLELNEDENVRQRVSNLLHLMREMLKNWREKVDTMLPDADSTQSIHLTKILLLTEIASALTYNIFRASTLQRVKFLSKYIVRNSNDLCNWLQTLSKLQRLVVRENFLQQLAVSTFLKNLLQLARSTIPLQLQDVTKLYAGSAVRQFASRNWHEAERFPIPTVETKTKAHTVLLKYEKTDTGELHYVCVDTLLGTFLVDGFPSGYLPDSTVRSQIFKSFFKTSKFRIQRDCTSFSTFDKYNGKHYKFFGDPNNPIIREMQDNGSENFLELMPKHFFTGKIGLDLIENYTHWYNPEDEAVLFRQNLTKEVTTVVDCKTEFVLKKVEKKATWELTVGDLGQVDTKLISINSKTFKSITDILERIEKNQFVHVFVKGNEVKAILRRLNLTFKVGNSDGQLYCENYPGFYIKHRASQLDGLGTLIGLQNGLVLEKPCISDVTGFKRILLVPHGSLEVKANPIHQRVLISVSDGELRHPPYFTYEVDTILKRLKPGNDQSAWLYLAALHASTASSMPDPFTKLTGVEMAMWILKSAFIFSCSPYNNECIRTFKQISSFSRSYSCYPEDTLTTQSWTSVFGSNSYAQYDGYKLAIQKLISDSLRLKDLFLATSSNDAIPEGDQTLTLRAYHLHINFYNRLAHVDPDLVHLAVNNNSFQLSSSLDSSPPKPLHELAQARRLRSVSSTASSISSLIMTDESLSATLSEMASSNHLHDWLKIRRIQDIWLGLYDLILNADNEVMHQLTFIFAAIIYTKSASMDQILNLHNISVLSQSSTFPPVIESLQEKFVPLSNQPEENEISSVLHKNSKNFPKNQSQYDTQSAYITEREKYDSKVAGLVARATPQIEAMWPVQSIDRRTLSQLFGNFYSSHFNTSDLEVEINNKLCFWYNNRNFTLFIQELEAKLNNEVAKAGITQVSESTFSPGNPYVLSTTWAPPEAFQLQGAIDLNFPDEQVLPNDVTQARERLIECEKMSQAEIVTVLFSSSLHSAFDKVGLMWRVRSPVALLRADQERLQTIALKMGVVWAKLKRINRVHFYQQTPVVYAVELERELATEGCENWNPMEYPEWLLLELELDITIRPVQVRVAHHMMEMKDEGGNKSNGVMQLNMGEGKTSVIVPMILSTLGRKKANVVCRVTVLNSIFETNSTLLRFAVGGLINKRIYTVPCRRDFPITTLSASILNTYEECLEMGGAIITLPEHRLSFRLVMYNSLLKEKSDEGRNLYEIEDWLRKHARDIVDESDEIFSVKYQLIYTTGQQQKGDGGRLRWIVCRKLLQLLQEIAPNLFELYGSSKIEFSEDKRHHFNQFRVLEEEGEFKQKLNEMMVDGILGGKIDLLGMILNEEEFEIVRKFLVKEDLAEGDHSKFMKLVGINDERRKVLLIVSGYLRRGILFAVLKKRWRVEFGVNPKGPRLLAVPFRAKDVAAERTEYGHADMAIALTYLSYYYSGLSDEQLMEVFKILEKEGEPESIYSTWISQLYGETVADSVKSYKGVNLNDYEQRVKHLFPMLRRHKLVVDFWLENLAFPNECKQFPGKLVTNAWDLCFDLNHQITTGFSGTNDTSELLPVQISQRDLDELKRTNEEVEVTLLRPENEYKRSLKMGVKCREIISYLKEDNLRVLIDTGALMLELGNEEVAKLWLEIDNSLECCMYFNEGNQLVVKARSALRQRGQAKDELFTLSSFRNCMDNCAIYLDDQHTRGVDLNLPNDFRACVTIGSGLRRDKLIQSCMRMRKLGKGQSVHFYLSHDVDTKMRDEFIDLTDDRTITVEHILNWTKLNSKKFEEDGLVYWANAGKSYAQKLIAEQMHIETGFSRWEQFGQNCHEDEVITLNELYGTYLQQRALSDIVPTWFAKLEKKLMLQNTSTKDCLGKGILSKIVEKIRRSIPAKIYTTNMLEEEQERELEVEEEKEARIERPSKETAIVPELHWNLVGFLFGDKLYSNNKVSTSGAFNLSDVFKNTTFARGRLTKNEWGRSWHVTQDFNRTIQLSENGVQDQFLRPVTYFISRKLGKSPPEIILISQFEANSLIPLFRQPMNSRKSKKITLHMFSPRTIDGQDILCDLPGLQLPPNSFELDVELLSPILIAAGNLYFESKEEQEEFTEFLGLVLRPWQEREEQAFRAGAISTTGFIDSKFRRRFRLCLKSKFEQDPVGLVRAIMKCRNERINDSCHVVKMLDQCAYVEM